VDEVDRLLLSGHGVLSLDDAARVGMTRAALRWAVDSGRLTRVMPGAYAATRYWELLDARARHLLRLRAALRRSPGSVAAGDSAALLWGLPLPGRPPRQPVLLRARTRERPEHGGRSRALHRRAWLEQAETTTRDGMPVTDVARTFVDAARGRRLAWALALADGARRAGCSREDLLTAVGRNPCAPGHRLALAAALDSDPAVESPLESLGRGVQLELGLPRPRTQVWVGDGRGEYRVDMLVEEHRTVVEADGRVKYEGGTARPGQVWADKRRTDRLLVLGYDWHPFVRDDMARSTAWGRDLLRTFARSARRRGEPVPVFTYPWA
jgi:very-short-patch-repair endonuclease